MTSIRFCYAFKFSSKSSFDTALVYGRPAVSAVGLLLVSGLKISLYRDYTMSKRMTRCLASVRKCFQELRNVRQANSNFWPPKCRKLRQNVDFSYLFTIFFYTGVRWVTTIGKNTKLEIYTKIGVLWPFSIHWHQKLTIFSSGWDSELQKMMIFFEFLKTCKKRH